MCILAWHQQGHQTTSRSMCHLSEILTSGAKATTEANTTTWVTLATTRSWLHDVWWKWILSHHRLLLKDAYSMEDAYITVPRWSQYWKSCLQNIEYLKRSDQTMDPSLQITSLQSSQRTGTLSTVHLHQETPGAMDRQSLQSRLLKDCSPMPSALDRIHILLC